MYYIGSIIAVLCGIAGAFLLLKLWVKDHIAIENKGQKYQYLLEISLLENSPVVSTTFYTDRVYRDPLSLLADCAELRNKRFFILRQDKGNIAVNINAVQTIRMQRILVENANSLAEQGTGAKNV